MWCINFDAFGCRLCITLLVVAFAWCIVVALAQRFVVLSSGCCLVLLLLWGLVF